jgi:hypothetical protein
MGAKTRGDLAGLLIDLPALRATTPEPSVGRTRRYSRHFLTVVGATIFVLAATSWAWNTWEWRSWIWRPHLSFLVLVLLAIILVRRSRWGRNSSHGVGTH